MSKQNTFEQQYLATKIVNLKLNKTQLKRAIDQATEDQLEAWWAGNGEIVGYLKTKYPSQTSETNYNPTKAALKKELTAASPKGDFQLPLWYQMKTMVPHETHLNTKFEVESLERQNRMYVQQPRHVNRSSLRNSLGASC